MRAHAADRPLALGTYLVVGLGRAGQAAIEALIELPAAERVIGWDRSTDGAARSAARRLRRRGVEVRLGGDGLAALAAAGPEATLVKSPGIDLRKPIFERARERGQQVLDELELGWRLRARPIAGITGTNGKSTTAKLIATVLAAAGEHQQIVGNTEFGPPLSAATGAGWAVCEVSSFQLETCSTFLPDVAVFTNLTLDHLARHVDMESYGAVKRTMFVRGGRTAGTSIVNVDDAFGRRLANDVDRAGGAVLSYGFHAGADVRIEQATWDMRVAHQRIRTATGVVDCSTRLPGCHNASNVAAAFAMGQLLGLSPAGVAQALQGIEGPPGRWEVVDGSHRFDVVVDFAHNPDGIRRLLETARAVTNRREGASLRTVFGPIGAHEPKKASEIGKLIRALSDHLILTTGTVNYDARLVRIGELRRAATGGAKVQVILDRRAAIAHALGSASPGDVVALLGVGAMKRLVVDAAGTVIPFDDRRVARELLVSGGVSCGSERGALPARQAAVA